MDFNNYPAPLKSAIRELAELHVRGCIELNAKSARDYVDDDVLQCWWVLQCAQPGQWPAYMALSDALCDCDEPTLRRAVTQLLARHPAALCALHEEIAKHVAGWLADEALDYANDIEPTDDELCRSYACEVDDPLIGDRRAIAGGAL